MSRINFLNTHIDNLTINEALEKINELINLRKCSYVVTPNVDHIVQLETSPEFKLIYDNASLVLTDGKPLIWISKFYKTPIKEKISGSDLLPHICKMSAEKGYKIFFLGAAEGIAALAAKNLILKFPNLKIAGTYSPPYGFENEPDQILKIEELVKKGNPDILIVAFGTPKQEIFIYKNKEKLGVPLSLGLGASLDFEAGNVKRAPQWMANSGLEWLYRITQDPKRLFKRYWNDAIKIIPIIFKYK